MTMPARNVLHPRKRHCPWYLQWCSRANNQILTHLLPRDITIWQWLFESKASPLAKYPANEVRGFTNALTKERISYDDLKKCLTWLSTALVKNYGFEDGDTISLFSPNTIWYPVAMHGVSRLGGIVSGASPAYNVEEMTYALKKSNAKHLMTVPASMDVAAAAAKYAGIPEERVILLDGSMAGFTTVKDLIELGKRFGADGQVKSFNIPRGKKNGDICAFLSFSSGTTGLPKAVMISHQNVIGQCLQIRQITPLTSHKALAVLPLFHITGLVHSLNLPILLNMEAYMLPAFSTRDMLDAIVAHQIPELLLVPPILIRMVRDPLVARYDLRHLTRFSSGAAPVSPQILRLLRRRFPHTGFKQGYGMTESCSCVTAHPPERYDYQFAHTVGMICASTEVKIVGEDGVERGVGQPGELWARGPQITIGYLDNEEATRERYAEDGFLRTVDQAVVDEDGLVRITDRIKEMIEVKGIAVAPAELEDLLLGHPRVEDCAVCGVPDEYSGEKPKAYVVPKSGVSPGRELGKELIKYVKEKKVRHRWIKEVEFTDAIPKSASGKILRRTLRDRPKAGNAGLVVSDEVGPRARL